jgi:hypothetical protein
MRSPYFDSSTGSTVTAATIVISTPSEAATARPRSNAIPSVNIPSSAMITVQPANRTARPAVSIAPTVAASTPSPACRFSRKRVTMNSA